MLIFRQMMTRFRFFMEDAVTASYRLQIKCRFENIYQETSVEDEGHNCIIDVLLYDICCGKGEKDGVLVKCSRFIV